MTDLFQPNPVEVEVATAVLPVVSPVEATTPLHAVAPVTDLAATVRWFRHGLVSAPPEEIGPRVEVFLADLVARYGHAQPHVAPAWFAPRIAA